MIDKKRELESLELKYQEIKKLSNETENIILKLKNDNEINREKQLIEERDSLKKEVDSLKLELEKKLSQLSELKTSNLLLLEELKESKRSRREKEIKIFQNAMADKLKIDLEDKIILKLNNFQKELSKKIKKLDLELMKEFSNTSHQLRAELKELTEKIEIFIEEANKKIQQAKLEMDRENSIFHNNIQKEYELKENEYLFEKEKKNLLLEKFIGLKGFNILGVISIFVGVFLVFRTQLKDILNNDYIKSSGSYLLGVLFLFIGEKLYQKNKKHFTVGLIGGGVGILYLATMLSTIYLGLFPMYMGLFIGILLTGIAILLALRYESQIVGILALIGGYVPYGAYIYYLRENSQIYYIILYSLILQGIILGVSWKKDWLYSKIIGFIIGAINMAGLVVYLNNIMNNKILPFIYIVIFTTAYSFIFLNAYGREKIVDETIKYIFS